MPLFWKILLCHRPVAGSLANQKLGGFGWWFCSCCLVAFYITCFEAAVSWAMRLHPKRRQIP
jgi:hypothetical protein